MSSNPVYSKFLIVEFFILRFSFVRTDRQTHRQTDGQIKLDCVAKTSLSAESNDCRLAAKIGLKYFVS